MKFLFLFFTFIASLIINTEVYINHLNEINKSVNSRKRDKTGFFGVKGELFTTIDSEIKNLIKEFEDIKKKFENPKKETEENFEQEIEKTKRIFEAEIKLVDFYNTWHKKYTLIEFQSPFNLNLLYKKSPRPKYNWK